MGSQEEEEPVVSHATVLLTQLRQLYNKNLLTDLVLQTEDGGQFHVHKNIIVSFSAYCTSLMNSGQLNSETLHLKGISSDSLDALLNFMYSGILQLDDSNMWLVFGAATRLDIQAAVKLCQEFILCCLGYKSLDMPDTLKVEIQPQTSPLKICPIKENKEPELDTEFPSVGEVKTEEDNFTDDNEGHGCEEFSETQEVTDKCSPGRRVKNRGRRQRQPKQEQVIPRRSRKRTRQSDKDGETCKGRGKSCQKQGQKKQMTNQKKSKTKHSETKPKTLKPKRKSSMKYQCRKCDKKFCLMSLRKLHERSRHLFNSGMLPCFITPALSFGKFCRVQRGKTSRHQKAYVCSKCNKHFRYFSLFCRHYQSKHKISSLLKCDRCQEHFRRQKFLLRHRWHKHKVPLLSQMHSQKVKICGECGRTYKHEALLAKHWDAVHQGLPKEQMYQQTYQCAMCPKNFNGKRSYMRHLLIHLTPPGGKNADKSAEKPWRKRRVWDCEECSESFPLYIKLRGHVEESHPGIMFNCQKCRYHSPVHKMLEVHMLRKHHNQSDRICEFCGKSFSRRYHLKFHLFAKHDIQDPSLKLIKCEVPNCEYTSPTKNAMNQHMRSHDSEKPFTCNHCGRNLKTASTLQKHINKVHLNIRPFVCDQCGMSYGEAGELKAHIARHSNEKKFKCEMCSFASNDKANLRNHHYSVHKVQVPGRRKLYNCEICGLTTRAKTFFTEHMNVHNNLKPIKCPKCDKTFTGKSSMRQHHRWVHTEKSVKCEYCSYVTSTKSHLHEHERIMHTHRDVKPYKCAYCDFHTALSGNCRKHIKNKHKGCEIKWIKVCEKYPKKSNAGESETQVKNSWETEKLIVVTPQATGFEIATENDNIEHVQLEEQLVSIPLDQQIVTPFFESSTIGIFVSGSKQLDN